MTRIDRPAPDIPDNQRCRFERRDPKGQPVQCTELGMWVLDEKKKTWRAATSVDRKRRCWAHGPGASRKPAGHNRRADPANERLQRYAALVLGLAPEVTKALRDVSDELSLLGYPSASNISRPRVGGTGVARGGDDPDDPDFIADDGPVSHDAIRIAELGAWREDLRDWIGDLEDRIAVGIHIVKKIRNLPPAAMGAKLCVDNQQDREGSIEWGNPTCTQLPTKAGLCDACYKAERRWLTARDKPTHDVPVE